VKKTHTKTTPCTDFRRNLIALYNNISSEIEKANKLAENKLKNKQTIGVNDIDFIYNGGKEVGNIDRKISEGGGGREKSSCLKVV